MPLRLPLRVHRSLVNGPQSNSGNPYNETFEVYFSLSGVRDYFIKDHTYRMRPGDLAFIAKRELRRLCEAEEGAHHERIVIQFDDTFLTRFEDPLLYKPFGMKVRRLSIPNLQEREQVEKLLSDMIREAEEPRPGSETSLQAQLAYLLICAGRRLEQQQADAHEHESPAHQKIAEVVGHINDRYASSLSLETVARSHYLSPYHLSRTFKRITGFSFVEYVNNVRVKEAQRLLKETNWKVTLIAERVGYENIGHFGRVFKELSKTSPLDYRKAAAKWAK